MNLPVALWRVFPWDPAAAPGDPFSPQYIRSGQGSGRFDVAGVQVLYAAELPEHAVAEKIGRYRGVSNLADYHLVEFDQRLALVSLNPPTDYSQGILDLCDPEVLSEHGIRPDHAAARDVKVSQAVSRQVYDAGFGGIRWWSAFFGEWHTVVLFLDRVPLTSIQIAGPTPLTLSHGDVRAAAAALGIRIPQPQV